MTWVPLIAGQLTRTSLQDALRVDVEIGDTDRKEYTSEIFTGDPDDPTSGIGLPTFLLGGSHSNLVDEPWGPRFRVTAVHAGKRVLFQYVDGVLPLAMRRTSAFASLFSVGLNRLYLNRVAAPYAVRDDQHRDDLRFYRFPLLRCEVYDESMTKVGEFTPLSRRFSVFAAVALLWADSDRLKDLFGAGIAFAVEWETSQPSVGTRFFLRIRIDEVSPNAPRVIREQPVALAAAVAEALGS